MFAKPLSHLESSRSPLFLLLLCCLVSLNVFQYLRYQNLNKQLQAPAAATLDADELSVEAVSANQEITLAQLGKTIHFGEELELINADKFQQDVIPNTGKVLVFVFSELTCNTCTDDETQFANELAQTQAAGTVIGIVYGDSRRYAVNYARMNQVKFPVFYDKSGIFLAENDIQNAPLVLCLADNKVVMSHLPISGRKEFCQPSHKFVASFIAKSPDAGLKNPGPS